MHFSRFSIASVLTAALAFIATAVLAYIWCTGLPDGWVPLRLPLTGGGGTGDSSGASPLTKTSLSVADGTASDLPGAWPGFRGANRDGISAETTPLAEAWATGGYGAFAVSESNVGAVREYIANQRAHHHQKTFQEEYRAFLQRHNIVFDERYVWD